MNTFHGAWQTLDTQKQSVMNSWWERIFKAYSERQRHYHILSHVETMYGQYYAVRGLIPEYNSINSHRVMVLAIAFHDIVYEPKSKTNELDSISKFEQFQAETQLCIQGEVELVSALIRCTIRHQLDQCPPEFHAFASWFLDFDLEVLGRVETEYDRYARQIRQEYIYFGDSDYQLGRVKVLESFLQRPQLYFTDYYRQKCESRARENVKRECQSLLLL